MASNESEQIESTDTRHGNGTTIVSATANGMRSIEFKGSAKEYFGIWISNLVLTIITLGIYSAWAKVRRKKYFLNNTEINEFSFNYHATGKQLLIGRLIALAVIIVYSVISWLNPQFAIFISIAAIFAVPWLLNQTMKFNARMTSWRNVRLNWRGTYWKSLWFFVVGPVLGVLSVGILLPYFMKNYYQYYAQKHSFGTTEFDASSRASKYYLAYLLTVILPLIIFGAALFLVLRNFAFANALSENILVGAGILTAVCFAITHFVFQTVCRNILVRTLSLGQAVTFNSNLKPLVYLGIVVTNYVAVILSLGFLRPWAAIRDYRYLCYQTQYRFEMDDVEFIDEERHKLSSFGEEFAGLEGIDISI